MEKSLVKEDVDLLTIFKNEKIDFSDLSFNIEDCDNLEFNYEISPKVFLRFAKIDFESGDLRGYVNAITNSKRAIDCQTDKILSTFNIDVEDIPKSAIEFIQQNSEAKKTDSRAALKLIQALDIAPIGLISKVRMLRHKLEHFYKTPTVEETKEAIDLAEFFINATQHKVYINYSFYIGNHFNGEDMFNHIDFRYDQKNGCFTLTTADEEKKSIYTNSVVFYYLLMLTICAEDINDVQDTFKKLLKFINHPIPLNNVKVT